MNLQDIITKLAGNEVAEKVQRIHQVSADVQRIYESLNALEFEYVSKKKALNETLKAVRGRCDCPEEFQDYVPDPSGNNDSYYECQICGKTR